ncbi:MAG: hypothetical protein AB1938_21075 [Myxococcota bacterium]
MAQPAEERVAAAAALLAIAEKELALALDQLETFDRADKKMISLVVQAALDKLSVARSNLEEAQRASGG